MASTIDQTAADFLKNHQLSPSHFDGDRRATLPFEGAYRADTHKLKELAQKNRALYGKNPAIDQSIATQKENLKREYADKARLHSIDQTLRVYQENPRSFDSALAASREAEYQLAEQKYDKAGLAVGGLTGGVAGKGLASIAARMKRVNPKFYGPIGGVAGIAAGAMLGQQAGRKANERVTGRQYTEIQTPYEIAQKMKHATD